VGTFLVVKCHQIIQRVFELKRSPTPPPLAETIEDDAIDFQQQDMSLHVLWFVLQLPG
jgi:hypothetical protein